ncbi:MAG: glucosamine-6-phosphate deaminase [Clostridia bacterium]|nr:glucosamine-6-phosphate deaminase [Clostridia bacterium]
METDINPLKTANNSTDYPVSSLTDCGIARCPDILAFHRSLNRTFEKDHDYSGERHPFYELVFVEEGTVGITAGEEVYTLSAGQVLLHSPDEFHRIWSEFESAPHVRNLSFFAAAVPTFGARVLQLSESECAELTAISDAVTRGLSTNDRALLNEMRIRLELWLLSLSQNEGEVAVRPSLPSALRYAEIVNVLHAHLREPLSAAEIAGLCNISLSALKKIFTRYAGMGVSRYFTEMKMRYAAEQLQSGMRVGEVAAMLGYFDQNYFSTVFRRVMGAPPGTYRVNEKKNDTRIERKEKNSMKFITVPTYEKMSRQAANIISAQVIMKPQSVLGLATGSSPLGIYRQLIDWYNKGDIDFSSTTSVNLDEYVGLAETDPQSYRYFMQTNFFDHINIRRENTFVPDGCAKDLDRECAEYDARIERLGGIDLQLLGIGLDGHIGFNEPSSVFVKSTHVVDLHESTIRANARFFENEAAVPRQAVTMGMISIMQAKKILLIANGRAKKDIVQRAFFGPITPEIPASILQLHPDLTVVFSEE